MSGAAYIAPAFLGISVVSLTMQTVAAARLLASRELPATREARLAYQGLRRTSLSRVATAVLYVALGVSALAVRPEITAVAALVLFGIAQLVWIANGLADVRLRGQLIRGSTDQGEAI